MKRVGGKVRYADRTCDRCGVTKKSSDFYFSQRKDHIRSEKGRPPLGEDPHERDRVCKVCSKLETLPAVDGERKCSRCQTMKNVSEFRGGGRYKFSSRCTTCIREVYLAKRAARTDEELQSSNQRQREYAKKYRLEALMIYGDGTCAFCGESDLDVLTLDHVDNDGHHHRKETGVNGGGHMVNHLRKRNWPKMPRIQTLCWNCNESKKFNNGVIPTKRRNLHRIPSGCAGANQKELDAMDYLCWQFMTNSTMGDDPSDAELEEMEMEMQETESLVDENTSQP